MDKFSHFEQVGKALLFLVRFNTDFILREMDKTKYKYGMILQFIVWCS